MPTVGSLIAGQLKSHVAMFRARSEELEVSLTEADQRADELLAKRGEALIELARHYLPQMNSAAVEETFVEIRDELRSVLFRQERRREQLNGEIVSLSDSVDRDESALSDTTARLNQLVRRREELESFVAKELDADIEHRQLSHRAMELERSLARNRRRTEEVRHEAEQKLPSYEESDLFQYLYRRAYASPGYQAWGPIRRLDAWVARMIDYSGARKSYEFLRFTPELMQLEVEKRAAELDELLDRIDDLESNVSDSSGLSKVLSEGESLGRQREKLVAALGITQRELTNAKHELASLDSDQSHFYAQGIERFKDFLDETQQSVLKHRASMTDDKQDDSIVAELGWLKTELSETQQSMENLSREKTLVAEQIEGLEWVSHRFRQMEYDSDRSRFPDGFEIEEQVARFARGETNREGLWAFVSRNQHFEPTWTETAANRVSRYVERDATRAVLKALANLAVVGADVAQELNKTKRSKGGLPGGWFTRGGGF